MTFDSYLETISAHALDTLAGFDTHKALDAGLSSSEVRKP